MQVYTPNSRRSEDKNPQGRPRKTHRKNGSRNCSKNTRLRPHHRRPRTFHAGDGARPPLCGALMPWNSLTGKASSSSFCSSHIGRIGGSTCGVQRNAMGSARPRPLQCDPGRLGSDLRDKGVPSLRFICLDSGSCFAPHEQVSSLRKRSALRFARPAGLVLIGLALVQIFNELRDFGHLRRKGHKFYRIDPQIDGKVFFPTKHILDTVPATIYFGITITTFYR